MFAFVMAIICIVRLPFFYFRSISDRIQVQ